MGEKGDIKDSLMEARGLIEVIASLEPEIQTQLAPSLKQLVESLRKRYATLQGIKEALGQLSMDMKYLVFDLQATRKERDEYKALWENR